MSQLAIIYRKELLETWRNRKWIWIPLVFILMGVMEPVSTYFMPQILKMSTMPAGTVIQIPTPSGAETVVKALSQYNLIGLLVLVLAFMGSVSGERQHGVLQLVMVKPVSFTMYVLAKWLSAVSVSLVSLLLGYVATWYYTEQLVGRVPFLRILSSGAVYALWILLVLALTIMLSSVFDSAMATAFIALAGAALLTVFTSLFHIQWSPGNIPSMAQQLVLAGKADAGFVASMLITVALVGVFLALAAWVFQRRDVV